MTKPQAARARKPRPTPAFDPHTARLVREEWCAVRRAARVVVACPSRRPNVPDHELRADEDGAQPCCSCEAYTFNVPHRCTHSDQAADSIRLAASNAYCQLPDETLRDLDRRLARRCGQGGAIRSIRYDVLGDEIAKRERLRDRPLAAARGQQAVADLFDESA